MNLSIPKPMPPMWLTFLHISQYSIGWRMGPGESYKYAFFDWFETLSEEQQKEYEMAFPAPKTWQSFYEPEDAVEKIEELMYYKSVALWEENGNMKYSLEKLLKKNSFEKDDFIFFWKPKVGVVDSSCMGQWQPSDFQVDTDSYSCTEQYMMAEKARLFEDEAVLLEIMNTSDPKAMKALGKKVKNFEQEVWNKAKYSIVLNGNYHKFNQNEEMRKYLLATEDKILVEASPLDTIWGIGLSENNEKANNPNTWRGQNLLGFALMEVRDDLRKVYQNYDKLNWEGLEYYLD